MLSMNSVVFTFGEKMISNLELIGYYLLWPLTSDAWQGLFGCLTKGELGLGFIPSNEDVVCISGVVTVYLVVNYSLFKSNKYMLYSARNLFCSLSHYAKIITKGSCYRMMCDQNAQKLHSLRIWQ